MEINLPFHIYLTWCVTLLDSSSKKWTFWKSRVFLRDTFSYIEAPCAGVSARSGVVSRSIQVCLGKFVLEM